MQFYVYKTYCKTPNLPKESMVKAKNSFVMSTVCPDAAAFERKRAKTMEWSSKTVVKRFLKFLMVKMFEEIFRCVFHTFPSGIQNL